MYFDDKSMFSGPTTKQYGSHMVMTNVQKEAKTKYINIDTKFRDEYNYKLTTDYNITLSERLTDVRNMTVASAEIPNTIYNISENMKNNAIKFPSSNILVVPDGHYTQAALIAALNAQSTTLGLGTTFDISYNKTTITPSGATTINFDVDSSGNFAKYDFKSRLGWLLGFRNQSYTFSSKLTSEFLVDLSGPRYLYLVVDEFTGGNQKSFVSPLPTSVINKNILARVTMNNTTYPFMSIVPANAANGLLLSDTRSYTGKVDIQKLNVQLINENGTVMNLNGADFSFCVRMEHE
jgi:hypothetical protein